MSSSAVSSCSISRKTWTFKDKNMKKSEGDRRCVCVCRRSNAWRRTGVTSSVIMVGQSDVRCWGDMRSSNTLKKRNTWAWRMGTWGRRRLSTRRSKHTHRHRWDISAWLTSRWAFHESAFLSVLEFCGQLIKIFWCWNKTWEQWTDL